MTITIEDHERVLDRFLEDMSVIKDDVKSFVLFGTAGRGGIIPGESDLMDAYCFLHNEVFNDKSRFFRVLEVLAAAFDRVAKTAPFPFHPFFYWDEFDAVPAHFIREMTTFSRIIMGEDIRDRIYTIPASRIAGRTAFFEIRRLGAPRMVLLHKKELTAQDRDAMYAALLITVKHMPMSACMVLDRWPGLPEGVDELGRALPELDKGGLEKITELRHQPDRIENPERLRALLREAMIFLEDLNDRLVCRLRDAGLASQDCKQSSQLMLPNLP